MMPSAFHQTTMPVIPDAIKRRLERHYGPSQTLAPHQNQSSSSSGHDHTMPSRSAATSTPSTDGHHHVVGRELPKCPPTDENFDDSYVAFILYCNPTIPLDTDTSELKKGFRSPPKSDGKSFSTYTLFELIRKLESKEIKTWAQLAIDLGVEPPALEKGQSAQKVQQYAVRLKVSRYIHLHQ